MSQRKGPKARDAAGRSLNLDGKPRKVQVRAQQQRDELGRAINADGRLRKRAPSGIYHPNYGRRWTYPPGKGNRKGGALGRRRSKRSISERILEGFGRELTIKRAQAMARRDPFRAAELAVRIEQAPALNVLMTPPVQYTLDLRSSLIEGES